ncbi:MAG: hypothetical protein HKN37_14105, partial [Rhodothermales bacterium]|nr:hypothetical protein [Rhodothermales bacterium]
MKLSQSHVRAFLVAAWTLAGALDVHGQANLRVTDAPLPLVQEAGAHFIQPRWSPDGLRLAFTSESYRGIWIASKNGTGVTQISDDNSAGFGFSWSPDGSAILTRVARYDGRRRADAVKLLEVDGRSERLLSEYRENMPVLPQWSRDAAHIILHDERALEVIA